MALTTVDSLFVEGFDQPANGAGLWLYNYYDTMYAQAYDFGASQFEVLVLRGSEVKLCSGLTERVVVGNEVKVKQPNGAGSSIPVLVLDQDAMPGGPFLTFDGNCDDGKLDWSIVDPADVSTATVIGYVRVHLKDQQGVISEQDGWLPVFSLS
jgi:hypothetical protein